MLEKELLPVERQLERTSGRTSSKNFALMNFWGFLTFMCRLSRKYFIEVATAMTWSLVSDMSDKAFVTNKSK